MEKCKSKFGSHPRGEFAGKYCERGRVSMMENKIVSRVFLGDVEYAACIRK